MHDVEVEQQAKKPRILDDIRISNNTAAASVSAGAVSSASTVTIASAAAVPASAVVAASALPPLNDVVVDLGRSSTGTRPTNRTTKRTDRSTWCSVDGGAPGEGRTKRRR